MLWQFIDVTHAQTTLWLGANGTIAHTHYDMGPNFHVMLDGTKRSTDLLALDDWFLPPVDVMPR